MLYTKDRTHQNIILFCFWPPPYDSSDVATLCDLSGIAGIKHAAH